MLFFSAVFLVDCEEWFCILLGSLPGARPCNRLHSLFAWAKSGRWLIDWLLRAFCTIRENPMLRILKSFSSCSDVDVLLHADSVVQHYVVFFPPDGWQWLSVFFVAVPSWKYRWVASVLSSLSGLWKLLFRLVVHLLSFRRFVLGSTTAVLLSNVSGDLRWRGSCSARTPLDSAKISHFFHNCNRLNRFLSMYCTQDIAVWKNFRKNRRSRCCSCRRSSLAILCWTCWSSASGSSPEWMIPYAGSSRTSRSTSWLWFSRVAIRCSTTKRGTPEIL